MAKIQQLQFWTLIPWTFYNFSRISHHKQIWTKLLYLAYVNELMSNTVEYNRLVTEDGTDAIFIKRYS